jgi:hypothetical protein
VERFPPAAPACNGALDAKAIQARIALELGRTVRHLRIVPCGAGVVLRGHARTYYAKQLAQQRVLEHEIPVVANEIEVG